MSCASTRPLARSLHTGLGVAPQLDNTGDQLNLILILDNEMRQSLSRLTPQLWVLSNEEPHQISGKLALQGPVVDTIANWLNAKD